MKHELEVNGILKQFKNGILTEDKTKRLLLVLFGVSKSAYCKLYRLKAECSIAQHTTPKDSCEGCGHYC